MKTSWMRMGLAFVAVLAFSALARAGTVSVEIDSGTPTPYADLDAAVGGVNAAEAAGKGVVVTISGDQAKAPAGTPAIAWNISNSNGNLASLTIDGGNKIITYAGATNTGQLLSIGKVTGTITLKNAAFKGIVGAKSSVNGAALTISDKTPATVLLDGMSFDGFAVEAPAAFAGSVSSGASLIEFGGSGGAMEPGSKLTLTSVNYSNNTVSADGTNYGDTAVISAFGGAARFVGAEALKYTGGAIEGNKVVVTNTTAKDSTQSQANGGGLALLGTGKSTIALEQLKFTGNSVSIDNAGGTGTGRAMGRAGALYVYNGEADDPGAAILNVTKTSFVGNTVTATRTFDTEAAHAWGGAVGLNGTVTATFSSVDFNGNTAKATNGQGFGGAIATEYSGKGIASVKIDNATFSNNTAEGGQQGWGGAIYLTSYAGASGIEHTITDTNFYNNKAISSASAQGGAISMNSSSSNAMILNLKAVNRDVYFQGNTQGTGTANDVANSIYLTGGANTLKVDAAKDRTVYMHDSMQAGMSGALDIQKTGAGAWYLAGTNNLVTNSTTSNFTVNAGTLELVSDAAGNAGAINLLSSTGVNTNSEFKLAAGSTLALNLDGLDTAGPLQIKAGKFTAEANSTITLAAGSYDGSAFYAGREILVVDATATGLADAVAKGATGSGTYGVYDVTYELDVTGKSITIKAADSSLNHERAATSALHAPLAFAATGGQYMGVVDHMTDLFKSAAVFRSLRSVAGNRGYGSLPARSGVANNVWASSHYNHVNDSGRYDYDLDAFGFSVGYDHWFSDCAFVGAAFNAVWPRYDSRHADVDSTNLTGVLYGGVIVGPQIELGGLVAYGGADNDLDRRVWDERYSENYDSRHFTVGVNIARSFDVAPNLLLRPFAAYEYTHLKTDSFRERPGVSSLRVDSQNYDLHLVRAGASADYTFCNGATLGGRVYYSGVFGDTESKVKGVFTASPTNSRFVAHGESLRKSSLGLGVSAMLPLSDRVSLTAGYDLLVNGNANSHFGNIGINIGF